MPKTRVAVLTDRQYTTLLSAISFAQAYQEHLEAHGYARELQEIYSALERINTPDTNGVSIYPNHSTLSDAA